MVPNDDNATTMQCPGVESREVMMIMMMMNQLWDGVGPWHLRSPMVTTTFHTDAMLRFLGRRVVDVRVVAGAVVVVKPST